MELAEKRLDRRTHPLELFLQNLGLPSAPPASLPQRNHPDAAFGDCLRTAARAPSHEAAAGPGAATPPSPPSSREILLGLGHRGSRSSPPTSSTARPGRGQLEKEFEGIYDRAYIKALVDASAEQLKGGEVSSFVAILAHRFARERLRAQAQAEGKLEKSLTEVVFVSLTGGGRAQMAAALLERYARGAVSCHTAGSAAQGTVDPNVYAVMQEIDIDLSEEFTRPLSSEVIGNADVVVTMGRSVGSVEIPGTTRHVDWRVGDPTGAELEEVRRVRDDIERRVQTLVADLDEALLGAEPAAQQ